MPAEINQHHPITRLRQFGRPRRHRLLVHHVTVQDENRRRLLQRHEIIVRVLHEFRRQKFFPFPICPHAADVPHVIISRQHFRHRELCFGRTHLDLEIHQRLSFFPVREITPEFRQLFRRRGLVGLVRSLDDHSRGHVARHTASGEGDGQQRGEHCRNTSIIF